MHRASEPVRALNSISREIIGAAIAVHRTLGPGLLESVYEQCLGIEMKQRGLRYEQQKPISITYGDCCIPNAMRLDLIVEDCVIVETKAVEAIVPLHHAQLLTYLRLSELRLGLLINFNAALLKDGIRRIAL